MREQWAGGPSDLALVRRAVGVVPRADAAERPIGEPSDVFFTIGEAQPARAVAHAAHPRAAIDRAIGVDTLTLAVRLPLVERPRVDVRFTVL